jgi:hypothetical protein
MCSDEEAGWKSVQQSTVHFGTVALAAQLLSIVGRKQLDIDISAGL